MKPNSSELRTDVKKGATSLEVADASEFADAGSAALTDKDGTTVISWTGKDGNALTGVSGITRVFGKASIVTTKDDLQVLKGVGPFIEEKLNALGITTYRQIANMNAKLEEQVNKAIEFFPGRIKRDQWANQAKILLGEDVKLDEKALKQAEELERIAKKAQNIDFATLGVASASEKDDLKSIKGIGPFIEEKLNALGIFTFDQVSKMTPKIEEEVNEAIEFFPGRVRGTSGPGRRASSRGTERPPTACGGRPAGPRLSGSSRPRQLPAAPHSHLQPVRRGILYPRQWPLLAHGDLCYSLRIADPRYRRDLPPPGNHRPLEDIDRKRHLKFDLAVVVVTSLMVAGITIMLIDGILTQWLRDNVQLFDEAVTQPLWIRISLALVVGDLGYYVAHRMMHTPLLWRTHVFHHSIQEIYWFSGTQNVGDELADHKATIPRCYVHVRHPGICDRLHRCLPRNGELLGPLESGCLPRASGLPVHHPPVPQGTPLHGRGRLGPQLREHPLVGTTSSDRRSSLPRP